MNSSKEEDRTRIPFHTVEAVRFVADQMLLKVDGQEIQVALKNVSPILAEASAEAREYYSVSPSGYGIHWPLLDEDLSVDGLLKESRKSCRKKIPAHPSS